jgi:hypothetical protein
MAYKSFDNKKVWTTGEEVPAATLNAWEDGVQDEMEERLEAVTGAGVYSGMAASIDGTSVDIATGDAYAGGKRFTGSDSVAFAGGDTAGTYYIFVDSSDETTPYDKSDSKPADDGADLLLASVAWDGAALTSLTDLRRWGIDRNRITVFEPGTVTTGVKLLLRVERDLFVESVYGVQSNNGSAGTTSVDVHAGAAGSAPTTIFGAEADRVIIAHDATDYTPVAAGEPAAASRKLSAGDLLLIEVDGAATGAQDLGVTIAVRYY